MKYNLVNGYIKFLKYTVEWAEGDRAYRRGFYNEEKKDECIAYLDEKEIEYTVTEYEKPSEELLQRLEGRRFDTVQEAREFVSDDYEEPLTLDMLAEVIADMIGGAVNA